MLLTVIAGIMLPFIGTSLGSSAVFAMKNNRHETLSACLAGFAGGVMLAASVWSLLLPAIEKSEERGGLFFLTVLAGFVAGFIFMIFSQRVIEDLPSENVGRGGLVTAFAVTVHNIPEGMAIGMVYAALLLQDSTAALAGAVSLSLGIAVQNIPEGAIVSMPIYSAGAGKRKAFLFGVLSGVVEPIAAAAAILCVRLFSPVLPFFLAFAAGAMIFVIANELCEEMKDERGRGLMFFAAGFGLMMSLDVLLG